MVIVDYSRGNLRSVEKGLALAGAAPLISADPAVIASADAIVLPGVGSFADASASMKATGQMQVIRERVRAGVPFLGICLGLQLLFERGDEGVREMEVARSGGMWCGGVSSGASVSDDDGSASDDGDLWCGGGDGSSGGGASEGSFTGSGGGSSSNSAPDGGASGVSNGGNPSDGDASDASCSSSDDGSLSGTSASDNARLWAEGLGLLRGYCRRVDAIDAEGHTYKVPHVGWNQACYTNDTARHNPLFRGVADGSNFYFTHSYQAVPRDSEDVIALVTHATPFTCAVWREQICATQFHPEKSSHKGLMVLQNFVDFVREA
jgi:glutamine amidotransferase